MATFHLTIMCSDTDEFESVAARFLGSPRNEPRHSKPEPKAEPETSAEAIAAAQNGGDGQVDEAETKPKRGRKTKAAEPTQQPDGTPIPPTTEPLPQPTPGGTEAPPAESIPPNQPPAGQPASQADVFGTGQEQAQASSAPPTAGSGDAPSGEVDLPMLKQAMADLLKTKSAGVAMKVLEDATGCKSLSSGSPSVIEKANSDPSIMKKTLDALVAAKDAA